MNGTIRMTAAQARMRWLSVQMTEEGERFIEGVWAIFGHGNVAGLGEALHRIGDALPTWRGQNEQTMAHAAIAYAKAKRRRRAQAVTSSIGPGATNLITAAALAHVNRLPVLFIPGDVFANRRPDPVLQQIEDFDDGTISAKLAAGTRRRGVQQHVQGQQHRSAARDRFRGACRLDGALAEKAADIADLEARIVAARGRDVPTVIVIETEAGTGTGAGGHWWDVAVPEIGGSERLDKAREHYAANIARQRAFN
jgi:TPP-dependent trihydroxycyclohexane-1,2-dione (THcHDO) dehydratase